jgi:excisionase family DNA binding protein
MSCLESIPLLAVNFTQAAAITSLSKSSLRRMAKDGRLRTAKLGRRVAIPVDGLRELVGFGAGEEKSSLAESAVAR